MAKNLAEIFQESAVKYANIPAYYSKDKKKNFTPTTYKEVFEKGQAFAESLISLGVKQRENIAILADNRLEWIIADIGVILAGGVDVPRGTDITDGEIEYILNHSEAKILILENDKILEKYKKNSSKTKKVKTIIILDPEYSGKDKSVLSFAELINKGHDILSKGKGKHQERVKGIKEDDLFTMIYTSGTTGTPKGVMLKHSSMIHQLDEVAPVISIEEGKERFLSILPVWHIFQRYMEYVNFRYGASSYYTNVRDLKEDLAKVKPTFMASAPRIWESIYNGLYTRLKDPKQTPPVRKALFDIAYFYSKQWNAAVRFFRGNFVDYTGRNFASTSFLAIKYFFLGILTGPFTFSLAMAILYFAKPSPLDTVLLVLAGLGLLFNVVVLDAVVLSKIRTALGGHLKASLSGGGALPYHVDAFFNDIGIKVLEGYGMTETSPVISVRSFDRLVIGSVGPIVPRVEVQIRDDHGNVLTHINGKGEILAGSLGKKGIVHTRGPHTMKGYYKNEEATKKTIKEGGWLDTGDIGMINFSKTLTLTGRAKDTVVLLGGENVEPVPIENTICESPYISQCMVVGQDQKTLGALIIPDFDKLKQYCAENNITFTSPEQVVKLPEIYDFYKKEVKSLNSTKTGFKSFEQVQDIKVISKPFEVGDELTNLMKMKRHIITAKYEKEIKALKI